MGRAGKLAMLTTAIIALITVGAAAPAEAAVVVSGPYYFRNDGPDWVNDGTNDRVLDVADWSTAPRGKVQMWQRQSTNNANQKWMTRRSDDGSFEIVNVLSGLCLDKSMDNGNVNGAAVYQYTCSGAINQKWYSPNNWQLISLADYRCLDIKNYGNFNGASMQVWDCFDVLYGSDWNQAFWKVNA